MNNFLAYIKTNWKTIALILFGLIIVYLLFMLFQPGTPRIVEKRIEVKYEDTTRLVLYLDSVKRLHRKVGSLLAEKADADRVMKKATTKLNEFIANHEYAKKYKDTAALLDNCDSLVAANVKLEGLIQKQQVNTDQLITQFSLEREIKDSAFAELNRISDAQQATIIDLTDSNNDKADKLNRANRKNRLQKTLTKITAGIAIAAAAAAAVLAN